MLFMSLKTLSDFMELPLWFHAMSRQQSMLLISEPSGPDCSSAVAGSSFELTDSGGSERELLHRSYCRLSAIPCPIHCEVSE